jgi:ferredoxin
VTAPKEQKPKEMIPVKVMLGGKEFNVEIPKAENLLDGVNDKGVDVKWDCKNGVCDTCKVKVVEGMENLSPPTDAEESMLGDLIKQGYRLACQMVANGPCKIEQ